MTGFKSIPVLALLAAMGLLNAAAAGRAVISTDQIAAAISEAGMKVSAEQITLLAEVVATTTSPTLKVQSMERWGDHRMRVRLACASSEECLPFLVSVSCSEEDVLPAALVNKNWLYAVTSAARVGHNSYLVQAGSPATLLIDGDHVHIKLSVICLESGAAGQTIRVASNDRRQTFRAEVVDRTLLRGAL